MIARFPMFIAVLAAAVFASAVGVIYLKHRARMLCTELQSLQGQVEALQVEWGQLLLEQGTWSWDARIEKIATQKMHMILPEPQNVVVIEAE